MASSNTTSNITFTSDLNYEIWDYYYESKKYKIVNDFEHFVLLDITPQYNCLVTNIKKILHDNIFNLSKISYLCLSFLDNYIGEHVLSIIENYCSINTDIQQQKTDIDIKINELLELLFNIIPNIELILNINFLILIDYIINIANDANVSNENNIDTSHIQTFTRYKKIIYDIKKNVTKSTWLLFCIRILSNKNFLFSNNAKIQQTIKNIDKDFLKTILSHYTNINASLDNFIIHIEQCTDMTNTETSNTLINNKEIFNSCIKFMIELANIFFTIFKCGYEELIKLLTVKYANETIKLKSIGNIINNFIEIEKAEILSKIRK